VNARSIQQYVFSCGLLLLPALLWNVVLARFLPPAFAPAEFWRDIPYALTAAENTLRLLVFVLPFFMPLHVSGASQRAGMRVFSAGTIVYFASWLAIIAAPNSLWSTSAIGFLAPAYTPILWLAGLSLLGRQLFCGSFYRWWMYLALSGLFLVAHVSHAVIVYARNY